MWGSNSGVTKDSGLLGCDAGSQTPHILKYCSAFNFRGKAIHKTWDCLNLEPMLLQNLSNHSTNNTASHHIGPESSVPQLFKLWINKKKTDRVSTDGHKAELPYDFFFPEMFYFSTPKFPILKFNIPSCFNQQYAKTVNTTNCEHILLAQHVSS